MKKTKLLTSLIALTGVSMGLAPIITSCSNNNDNVELDESVTKQKITIKSSHIAKDKESTITFGVPPYNKITAIILNIGNTQVTEKDITIKTNDTNTITIPADKMVSDKVIVKSITLTLDKKVKSIEITQSTTEVTEEEEIELTANVLPVDATNKKIDWTVTPGTGSGEITTHDNKTFLKGGAVGDLTVVATAKDGGGATGTAKFTVKAKIITKEQFFKVLTKWCKQFADSTTEYQKEQIAVKINGVEKAFTNLTYTKQGTVRECTIQIDAPYALASTTLCNNSEKALYASEADPGVLYTITDDYIEYVNPNATSGYKHMKFNKYGYLLNKQTVNGDPISYTYTSVPAIHIPMSYSNFEYTATGLSIVKDNAYHCWFSLDVLKLNPNTLIVSDGANYFALDEQSIEVRFKSEKISHTYNKDKKTIRFSLNNPSKDDKVEVVFKLNDSITSTANTIICKEVA